MFYDPSPYDWSGYAILIVEDDVSSTFYLKEILRDTKIGIFHAPNGQVAIDLCTVDLSIKIVLMDMRMPVINGYDATRAIKLIRPDLPVIAQTADITYNNRIQCLDAGCDDFISKPIDSVELLTKISSFLK